MILSKRGTIIATIMLLVAASVSACDLRYSTPPAATFTPVSQNLFATPVDGSIDMGTVQAFTTGTAQAQLTTTPSTGATATLAAGVTPQVATATATPLVVTNPTSTATLAVSNGPTATTIPAGSRPTSYTLQEGEFVYCIARRFNVDPAETLALNGLTDSQTIYAGLVIKIPQTGHPFPGDRMLRNHPTTYTVSNSSETVYSVACTFGDVDPAAIAQVNNISVNAALSVNQTLNIP